MKGGGVEKTGNWDLRIMCFEYVKKYYGVPACFGRVVIVGGKDRGVIVEDKGNYIGVLLDKDKANDIKPYHPTCGIEYTETIEPPRKMTRSQKRYHDFLKVADCYDSFAEYLGIKNSHRNHP